MLRRFEIRNYRPFKRLSIDGFERVNLIAGRNNAGKTALLEALHTFSHPDNCNISASLNTQRGLQTLNTDPWNSMRWLFHGGDPAQTIELSGEFDQSPKQTLQIEMFDAATANSAPYAEYAKHFTTHFRADLWDAASPRLLQRCKQGSLTGFAIGVLGPGGVFFINKSVPFTRPSILIHLNSGRANAALNHHVADLIEMYSELEATGRQDEVLDVLKLLEPKLEALTLLAFSGEPLLHAKVGQPRPVPVALMGEGFQRLLFIALVIAMRPGGIVLIDEVENGLHYSVLGMVWKVIAEAARRADVQVFATTHSWECIRSAHETFDESGEYDFKLLRLDRVNGATSAVAYDRDMVEAALLSGLEMR